MKLAVLTGCLPNYNALGIYTIHINKAEYCRRHGYALELATTIWPKYANPASHAGGYSWSRLARMREILIDGPYDWVWCVGCDTLVTNMLFSMDELINGTQKHVLISGERVAPLQADSFLVRQSKEGIGWLTDILSTYPQYRTHVWVENQAMIDRRDRHAAITQIVPQWRLNSYDYRRFYHIGPQYRDGTDCYGHRGQWLRGDFLIHWPAATLDERLGFLDDYTPEIVR